MLESINKEPWNINVCARYSSFISSKKRKVMYLYEQADTSTFRYRVYNAVEALKHSRKWGGEYFFIKSEEKIILELIKLADCIVFTRVRWSFGVDKIINRAKIYNKIVVFDCDDYVFDIEMIPIIMNSQGLDNEYNNQYWFSYVSRLQYTASKADYYIATNKYLGDRMYTKFGKPYMIFRNTFNDLQLEASKYCNTNKKKEKIFTIGYFSGTPTHYLDFCSIVPEICLFLEKHEDSKLIVVGFMEFHGQSKQLLDSGRIEYRPLCDFVSLQSIISEVNVNLVPLLINDFTNCKSELKFFEAALVNAITLASPNYTYSHAIVDGETGFLCNSGEWYSKIEYIYKNQEIFEKMKKKAYDYVIDNYYNLNNIEDLEKIFDFMIR